MNFSKPLTLQVRRNASELPSAGRSASRRVGVDPKRRSVKPPPFSRRSPVKHSAFPPPSSAFISAVRRFSALLQFLRTTPNPMHSDPPHCKLGGRGSTRAASSSGGRASTRAVANLCGSVVNSLRLAPFVDSLLSAPPTQRMSGDFRPIQSYSDLFRLNFA
jgi:hypothetical protein